MRRLLDLTLLAKANPGNNLLNSTLILNDDSKVTYTLRYKNFCEITVSRMHNIELVRKLNEISKLMFFPTRVAVCLYGRN